MPRPPSPRVPVASLAGDGQARVRSHLAALSLVALPLVALSLVALSLAPRLALAEEPPAVSPADPAPPASSVQAQAEIMLTGAVRLLAKGDVSGWLDGYCSDCKSAATRERWRRYQLSTALRNAQYCLHGEAPGHVEVVRWRGDLAGDGQAKAYLQCGGGQHGEAQQARLPVPVTVVLESNGELRISQLAI